MNEEDNRKTLVPIEDDEFDYEDEDAGISRVITQLAFTNDYKWIERRSKKPAPSGELLLVDKLRQAIRFHGKNEPPEVFDIPKGRKMGEFVAELNAQVPRDQWRADKYTGVVDGGWRGQHVLLFLDEKTYDRYAWSTQTTGGIMCVEDISAKIRWYRRDVPGALVYVTLGNTFFPTGFGDRLRPHMIVTRWRDPRAGEQKLAAPPTAPTLPPPGKAEAPPAEPTKAEAPPAAPATNDMDDEIPF